MENLNLVIENTDGYYWGWVESQSKFTPTGQGENIDQLKENIKDAISDYLEHEGKEDLYWAKMDVKKIDYDIKYNLEAFFEEFDFINISAIAAKSGLSKTVLNQYKSGTKQATEEQARKIETAIHELAMPMANIKLVA